MPTLLKSEIQVLKELLSLPTAPYREHFVTEYCRKYLKQNGVPFFSDSSDNIIVGFNSLSSYKKALKQNTQEPLKMLIAHTDHPGFHGARWLSRTRLEVKWLGGAPIKALRGQSVWIAEMASPSPQKHTARIISAKLNKNKTNIQSAIIELPKGLSMSNATLKAPHMIFGAFAFKAPVWQQGRLLYTGGADDIVGVFSILSCAAQLWRTKASARHQFCALLSRAEEVGFIGTIAHFENVIPKKHRRPLMVLSLEASRTLPGALIGKGPVLRLGDRSSIFDSQYSQALLAVAQDTPKSPFQRRIMDGGSCEATAAIAYGYRAIGISVPLGNYHNISFEGGPSSKASMGPGPEFVHLDDVSGQRDLSLAFVKTSLVNSESFFSARRRNFKKMLRDASKLLTDGA